MNWYSLNKHLNIQYDGTNQTVNSPDLEIHKTEVVSITVQSGFTRVPASCFLGCIELTSLELPDSIEIIEDNIIYGTKIAIIHIPLNVRELSSGNPFDFTQFTLEKFTISQENQYYTVVDDVLYTKDMKRLVCYPGAKKQTSFFVPNSVETIGCASLDHSNFLKVIILPPSVNSIEDYFASYINNLVSIVILYSDFSLDAANNRVKFGTNAILDNTPLNFSDIEWKYFKQQKLCTLSICRMKLSILTLLYTSILFS